MVQNSSSNQTYTSTNDSESPIEIIQIFRLLSRHKTLVIATSAASLVFSAIYAFTQKPVWEGQFEIVLANNQSSTSQMGQLLQSNPGLASIIGTSVSNNQLETEVKILESPSVLKPVFDFVKQEKEKEGQDLQNWRYTNWLNGNLKIKLVNGTSVLELSYQDTDKHLVLPVIKRISQTYQSYSGRDRERGINQAIQYLDEQIKIYNQKSSNSLRAAQQFGIEQNLTALQGDGADDAEIKNSLNIEAIRIRAANEIRNIDEQLRQLDQIKDNPKTLMYMGSNIPDLSSRGLTQTLEQIDTDLAILRAKYKDQDDSIRRLLEKRKLLTDVFKQQTYGYLYAQRAAAEARLKAAERPKGVLIKFRELLRTATREEATLTRLESERQILALEQARKQEPWELISTPTLLDRPVAPRKKRIVALGLLGGLVLGSGAALVVDRRSGLVYSEEELKSLLPCPLIKRLPALAQDTWKDAMDLLAAGPLATVSEKTTITYSLGTYRTNSFKHLLKNSVVPSKAES